MRIIDAEVCLGGGGDAAEQDGEKARPVLRAAGIDAAVTIIAGDRLPGLPGAAGLVAAWAQADFEGTRNLAQEAAEGPGVRALRVEVDGAVLPGHPGGARCEETLRVAQAAGLACELVVGADALPAAVAWAASHPEQTFVLANLGAPHVRAGELEPWRTQLRLLARHPNVRAKVGGLIAGADPRDWDEARLWPFFDTAVSAFRPGRLMFSSHWPHLLEATTYGAWLEIVLMWTDVLTEAEEARLLGGTAAEVYRL